jgi:peptidoglycan-N-acetylglucosamine deacetylase
MKVTLSFDNGPTPTTARVLDVLAAHGVKSTFFVVAEQLRDPAMRALSERAAAEGHWIGNHTLTHTVQFGDRSDPTLPEIEIGQAQSILGPLAHPAKLFRPYAGGGVLNQRVFSPAAIDYLRINDYTCVLWTSVPHDWDAPDQWVTSCLNEIGSQPWSVVVVHDLPTGAMDHLPQFLNHLDRIGAEVVQEFPDSCVPIAPGKASTDLSALTTG